MMVRNARLVLPQVLLANPGMLRVKPGAGLFMARYMNRFPVRRFGRNLVLHSHLPPLTSKAYSRFVAHHLVARSPGPSHAQVGLTNACPQDCEYCYNKQRTGVPMDTATILRVIDDLREAGVAWLGLTGGEPLLNRDIVDITAYASPDMAVKLFTTGVGLTPSLAEELVRAGLFSVAVSLDHWEAERHDASRRYEGAFEAALAAIATFKQVPGLHVSVSSVLSREMVKKGEVATLLAFLDSLGVDEAWLSEVKPSVEDFWSDEYVLSEEERRTLARMQDDHNREVGRRQPRSRGAMSVNYLGHFEGAENFGCNAGNKMVYVDAFGEVSPCVFLPMSFGSVRERSLAEILHDMRGCFPGEDRCFCNKNYRLLRACDGSGLPLDRDHAAVMLGQVRFGPPSEFNRILLGGRTGS
ncbi:MAG: radical SAM protein [Thermoleophilia bacterium]|nr:radical SAM protein [Thermoleophilia bacterium]